jgi:hypothetical protein
VRLKSVLELPEQHRANAQRQINGAPPASITLIRSTLDPAAALAVKVTKPSKYRNTRVELDGEKYDSRKEYEFHQVLKARQRAGEITLLLRQVPFVLEGNVRYRADFVCSVPAAPFVEVWDVKGFDTRSSINKRKQVCARYGIEVMLWPPRAPKGE